MRKQKTGMILTVLGAVLMLSALLLFIFNQMEEEHASESSSIILEELQKELRNTLHNKNKNGNKSENGNGNENGNENENGNGNGYENGNGYGYRYENGNVDENGNKNGNKNGNSQGVSRDGRNQDTRSRWKEETFKEQMPEGADIAGQGQQEGMKTVEMDGYPYIGYLTISKLDLELPVMSEWNYPRLKISPCRQFGSVQTDDLVIAAHNYKSHFGRLSRLIIGDEVCFTDMEGNTISYRVEKTAIVKPTEAKSIQDSGFDLVLYTCTLGGKTRVTLFCNRVKY